jgi:hypothetical protein
MSEIRSLAIATYNDAYELVVERAAGNEIAGLELAATSLNLWRRVGTDQNLAIGLWLYSRALGNVGAREGSLEAAQQCVVIAESLGVDWLLASALEGLARASVGTASFAANLQRAAGAIAQIQDPDDRELIESQFADLR